jgi:hypothetical protein
LVAGRDRGGVADLPIDAAAFTLRILAVRLKFGQAIHRSTNCRSYRASLFPILIAPDLLRVEWAVARR